MKKLKLTTTFLALFVLALAPKTWANCPEPTNLQALDVTPDKAVLTWEAARDAYRFAVKVVNGPNTPAFGLAAVTDAPRIEIRGLVPGGEYLFVVKAWCSESLQDSDYSGWAVFRTPDGGAAPDQGRCAPPADLKAIDVSPFGATLKWAAAEAAGKYELEFQAEGQTAFNIVLRETDFRLDRLSPETTYRFRVRSYCPEENVFSEYSGWYDFRTPPRSGLRIRPGTTTPAAAYPNPADQRLNLRIPAMADGQPAVLKAFDARGRLLLETAFTAYQGQAEILDVADLPDGMYFLAVESNGQRLMEEKVMVAHR
ncbi:MAG: fibronectin type III domain-containing protein [Phaeodactylibacter sp.]|nr:fibronectin type III domain-containing protein [Phaeodactylibacter sp.]